MSALYFTGQDVIRLLVSAGADEDATGQNVADIETAPPGVHEVVAFQGVSFQHMGGGDWVKGT